MQTVGPNSAHPDQQLYKDYFGGFEPAIGSEVALPHGSTVFTARVRDKQGGVGDPVQIVVQVP